MMASLKTEEAPGGNVLSKPLTSRCTVPDPMRARLATPSSAMSAGNRAGNQ